MSDPDRFIPGTYDTFRVVEVGYDEPSRTVSLGYAFDDGPRFVETVTFETPPAGPPVVGADFERALLHLHVAAGTSYYKAAAPATVVVESGALTGPERDFHHHLYDEGLREFAVENGLAVPRAVTITSAAGSPNPPATAVPDRPGGLVVPIGGGKDSMVLIEALRPLGPRLLAVNPQPLVVDLAAQAGLELLVVRRRLSPVLSSLNAHGALNGHVPITAIVSLIAVAAGQVYGYDTVAMAIERSASEETVSVDGVPVNHQYSKSLEFERLLDDLVRGSINPSFTYGSALRPYSELAIARAFAALPGYHRSFCSCNTAFRQSAGAGDRWCGACAKCRFVALMLAPYLSRRTVTDIIGRDLFADPAETAGFAALMSRDDKPFECVGERRESAAAFRLLADQPEWKGSPVVTALADRARGLVSDQDVAWLLAPATDLAFPDAAVAAAVDRFFARVT
jgi:UDP-N-acetyl-alpha-D-muramoyl-L-alanyl-L-glutamate epimerase